MYNKRLSFLHELLKDKDLIGLEIGALDKPLLVKDKLRPDVKILYGDHLSTEGLKSKYKQDQSVDQSRIVEVDLISPSGEFADALNGQTVDFIIASHVVEHVPNPIHWLQKLFEILSPGGFLFLVIPDKRFTFDYQRPLTTFGVMLQSYLLDKNIPSVSDVFDHYSSAVMVDGAKIWSGPLGAGDLTPLTSQKNAFKYAQEVHQDNVYHDVHVSVFTPLSFFSIVERLIHTELLMSEVASFRDTDMNDIEFFVSLRKPEGNRKNLKQTCLASIPPMSIETLVSPYMPQVKSLAYSLERITSSHSKLEREVELQNDELITLRERLSLLDKVLARRSVHLVMSFTHYLFALFPFLKNKKRITKRSR